MFQPFQEESRRTSSVASHPLPSGSSAPHPGPLSPIRCPASPVDSSNPDSPTTSSRGPEGGESDKNTDDNEDDDVAEVLQVGMIVILHYIYQRLVIFILGELFLFKILS